jgi:hypothetical protein
MRIITCLFIYFYLKKASKIILNYNKNLQLQKKNIHLNWLNCEQN